MTPFNRVGDGTATIHFAHANGFPPLAYRAFLDRLAAFGPTMAVHHRPLWPGDPDTEVSGYGNADPWALDYSWRGVANDLITFFDEHKMRDVIGIGHSLGSVATMYAALQRPDLFRALILIEPVFLPTHILEAIKANPDMDPTQMNPMVGAALRRRNQWETREEAWGRFREKTVFGRFSDDALWDYVNHALVPNAEGFTLAYSREWEARFYSMPPLDVWERVGELTQPTLAVRAEASDTLFPPSWALWQELQPTAEFIQIDNCGHMVPIEKSAELMAAITPFIERNINR